MNINLPLLSQIIGEMIAGDQYEWFRESNPAGTTLEVTRSMDGLVSFGLFESSEGDRYPIFKGVAKLNDDGSMVIDPLAYDAYQSFVEASRLFLL